MFLVCSTEDVFFRFAEYCMNGTGASACDEKWLSRRERVAVRRKKSGISYHSGEGGSLPSRAGEWVMRLSQPLTVEPSKQITVSNSSNSGRIATSLKRTHSGGHAHFQHARPLTTSAVK